MPSILLLTRFSFAFSHLSFDTNSHITMISNREFHPEAVRVKQDLFCNIRYGLYMLMIKNRGKTISNWPLSHTLQSLTGNYRFFTGKFAYREIQITCFGSVQGLKGQISMKYREIYAFCTEISILYLHSYLCFYNRDFPVL